MEKWKRRGSKGCINGVRAVYFKTKRKINMNLTNEQKRKILNDAPMGMTHAMIKIGEPVLTVDYAHKKDYGDRVAYMDNMGLYFEVGHWEVKKLEDLQGEVDAEDEKAAK